MAQTKKSKTENHPTTRLSGDAETLCAVLARIIARVIEQEHPHPAKA